MSSEHIDIDGSPQAPAKRRRIPKFLKFIGGALALLVIFVAALPSLISWGMFQGLITGKISGEVNGTVTVEGMVLGWWGPMRVKGLAIDDEEHHTHIKVDATIEQGLWTLLTSGVSEITGSIQGSVSTRQGPDGELGVTKLARAASERDKPVEPKDKNAPPFPAGMNLSLAIGPITVEIDDADGKDLASISNVKGQVKIVAGGAVDVQLDGAAKYLDTQGAFSASAAAPGLVAADGRLVWKGTPLTLKADASSLRFAAGGASVLINSAQVVLTSTDLTDSVKVAVAASGAMDGEAGSSLQAELQIAHPFTADGAVRVELSGIGGTLVGRSIPTAPLQFLVRDTPIVLSRDVGPTVDFNGSFADATGSRISFTLQSAHLKVHAEGAGNPQTQAAALPLISLEADVSPELAAAHGVRMDAPGKLTVNANDVVIPARSADGALPYDQLEFRTNLVVALRNPTVEFDGEVRSLGISSLNLTANAKPVAKGVEFALNATPSAGAPSPFRVTGTVVPGGRFGVHGSIQAIALPTALFVPWMPAGPALDLMGDVGPTIDQLLATIGAEPETTFTLSLRTLGVLLDAQGTSHADGALSVAKLSATAPAITQERLLKFGVTSATPVRADVQGTNIRVPAPFTLGNLSGNVQVSATAVGGGPVHLKIGEHGAKELIVKGLGVTVATARVQDKVDASVTATVNGFPLRATLAAEHAVNAADAIALDTASFDFRVASEAVLPADIIREVPSAANVMKSLGDQPIAAECVVKGSLSNATLNVKASGNQTNLTVQGALTPGALEIDAQVAALATPELVEALDVSNALPFQLMKNAQIELSANKVRVPRAGQWDFGAPTKADVTVKANTLSLGEIDALASPIEVRGLNATATVDWTDRSTGTAQVQCVLHALRADGSSPAVGTVVAKLGLGRTAEESWDADAQITDINGEALEGLLGVEPDMRGKIGTGGSVRVHATQLATGAINFTAESRVELFQVSAAGQWKDDVLTLQPSTAKVMVPGPQVVAFLNSANADGAATWKDADALEVEAAVTSFTMRTTLPKPDASVEAAKFTVPPGFSAVGKVSIKPLVLAPIIGKPVQIKSLNADVSAPGVGKPVQVNAQAELQEEGAKTPSAVTLVAALADWSKPDGSVNFDTLQIEGALRMNAVSTAVAGVVMGWGSELEEALGPAVTADIRVRPTGPGAGMLNASVTSEFLTLEVPGVRIEKGFVVIPAARALQLSFIPSEPLRERLLEPINPVLTDATLADPTKPITLTAGDVQYPLDGNYANLNATLELKVGAVLIRRNPQNELLNILKVFQSNDGKPVDGLIEPLNVQVKKGQLAYQNFNINIEKQGRAWVTRLIFSGDIDLTKTPPYARSIAANYPMSSLAKQMLSNLPANEGGGDMQDLFRTLGVGALDLVQLRVSVSGYLGDRDGKPMDLDRKIKVEFKPDALGKGLGETVKGAGDLLKDIFKKKN